MIPPVSSSAEAERLVDAKRVALASSIEQLQDNLQPSNLVKEATWAVRRRTPDPLLATWAFLHSPMGVALIVAAAASVGSARWARHRRLKSRWR